MIWTEKINLSEIIKEHATDKQLFDMFIDCLFSMSDNEKEKSIKYILDDLLQSEIEFSKRDHLINAFQTLINEPKLT